LEVAAFAETEMDVWRTVELSAALTVTICVVGGVPATAWKITLLWPGLTTATAGTVSAELSALMATVRGTVADCVRVAVQLEMAPGFNWVDEQFSPDKSALPPKDRVAVTLNPFDVAVSVAF